MQVAVDWMVGSSNPTESLRLSSKRNPKCALILTNFGLANTHHRIIQFDKQIAKFSVSFISFVELGGGVDDVPRWCCDGAYIEFGFR